MTTALHYRPARTDKACAVCGVKFPGDTSNWWLRNTWTDRRDSYRRDWDEFGGEFRPCGTLKPEAKA